jgi:hypothetical protein
MICNAVVVVAPVKIHQDEEASEPESAPHEWVWDPFIEIGVFPGGWIIGHDGRFVIVIVILNNRGLHIFGNLRRRGFGA